MMERYIKYVGTPYVTAGRSLERDGGLDCWGLVRVIVQDLFNFELPAYEAINTHLDINQASEMLVNTPLYKNCEEVDVAQEGDLLLFNIVGNPLHVGYALSNTQMIHADRKTGTVVENFRGKKWQTRLYKIYRLKL